MNDDTEFLEEEDWDNFREDDDWDDSDYCYECSGYGDDYYEDENGELVCRCPECLFNPANEDD